MSAPTVPCESKHWMFVSQVIFRLSFLLLTFGLFFMKDIFCSCEHYRSDLWLLGIVVIVFVTPVLFLLCQVKMSPVKMVCFVWYFPSNVYNYKPAMKRCHGISSESNNILRQKQKLEGLNCFTSADPSKTNISANICGKLHPTTFLGPWISILPPPP